MYVLPRALGASGCTPLARELWALVRSFTGGRSACSRLWVSSVRLLCLFGGIKDGRTRVSGGLIRDMRVSIRVAAHSARASQKRWRALPGSGRCDAGSFHVIKGYVMRDPWDPGASYPLFLIIAGHSCPGRASYAVRLGPFSCNSRALCAPVGRAITEDPGAFAPQTGGSHNRA